jgi:hypothetical protein
MRDSMGVLHGVPKEIGARSAPRIPSGVLGGIRPNPGG